jgi:hypothetical protein
MLGCRDNHSRGKRWSPSASKSAHDATATSSREGLIEALSAACLLFIRAADSVAAAFDRPDVSDQLLKQVQLFSKLPNVFPGQLRS